MLRLTLALATVLLAGCSFLPPPAGIQLMIPAAAGVGALPVTVVDNAGIVREGTPSLEAPAPDWAGGTTVEADEGRDDAVLVRWLGGTCDDRAIVTVDQLGDRYRVSVESKSSAMSCSAAGVIRAVRLSLTQPVGAEAFEAP